MVLEFTCSVAQRISAARRATPLKVVDAVHVVTEQAKPLIPLARASSNGNGKVKVFS